MIIVKYVRILYCYIFFVGNQTTEVDFDYYTAIAFPTFDTILPYTTSYNLSVKIVPNSILENNKLFLIAAQPEHRLLVQPDDCHAQVDVIIVDDDGNFIQILNSYGDMLLLHIIRINFVYPISNPLCYML